MNPTKNVWDKLDRKVHNTPISSLTELRRNLQEDWEKLRPEYVQKLTRPYNVSFWENNVLKVMPLCQNEPYRMDKVHFETKAMSLFTKPNVMPDNKLVE